VTHQPPSVVCAGRVYCDLIFTGVPQMPVLGQEVFADELALHAGGGAFITAATFAALGLKTSVAATLPAPPFDGLVRNALTLADVDASLCQESATGAQPQITVATVFGGDRAFLTHKTGAAVPEVSFADTGFTHLHIGELATLAQQPELLDKARAAGMTVSSDCGWDADVIGAGRDLTDLIAGLDVFLPNASEFDGLIASGLDQGKLPLTVVKLGDQGAKLWDGQSWYTAPTTPVEAVDTTGAGDAFNGGFLSQWLAKAPYAQCLNRANTCGAATVQHVGGTGGLHVLKTDPQSAIGAAVK